MLDVLARLQTSPEVPAVTAAQHLRILAFGKGNEALAQPGIPAENLGVVEHDGQVARIYSAADLLILPSREDNLPNVLLEAMAFGTPVVAFAVGGAAEVIDDGRNGVLVPPWDAAAMASVVIRQLATGVGSVSGVAARTNVAGRYPLRTPAEAYASLSKA